MLQPLQLHSSGLQVDQQELDEVLIHFNELWAKLPTGTTPCEPVAGDQQSLCSAEGCSAWEWLHSSRP